MPRVLVEHGFATRSVQLLIARIPHDFQAMQRVPMLGGGEEEVLSGAVYGGAQSNRGVFVVGDVTFREQLQQLVHGA